MDKAIRRIWVWGLLFPHAIQMLHFFWTLCGIKESEGWFDPPLIKMVVGAWLGFVWASWYYFGIKHKED